MVRVGGGLSVVREGSEFRDGQGGWWVQKMFGEEKKKGKGWEGALKPLPITAITP